MRRLSPEWAMVLHQTQPTHGGACVPKVKKSVSVAAPVDLVDRAWHNFENFPAFMSNIEEVRVVGGGRSH